MKRCVFCGTENDDSATECVKCHNQLPDRPDGEESRAYGFSGDPSLDGQPDNAPLNLTGAQPAMSPADGMDRQPEADEVTDSAAQTGAEAETAGVGRTPEGDAGMQAADAGADQAAGAEGQLQQGDSAPQDGQADDGQQAAGGNQAAQAPEDDVRIYGQTPQSAGYDNNSQGYYDPAFGQTAQDGYAPADQQGYGPADQGSYEDPFAGQPEGTTSGRIPPRGAQNGDFGVGRGQTYGARQQYEARGGRYDAQARDQYGSGGYGYRQPADQAAETGRTDLARMNTAVGSKTILFRSRKMVKGFLFFLVALSFTAMLVMNFWNCAVPGTMDKSMPNAQLDLNYYYNELVRMTGTTSGFGIQLVSELGMQVLQMVIRVLDIIKSLGTSVQLSILLIITVPNLFFALAQWIMFAQTKRDRSKFGMGGYTLARVMMILKMIVACLLLVVGLVISVYFVVVGARGTELSGNFIQGLIMLVTMIIIAIFTIMYYVQWIFTLKCMKVNVRSGIDIGRVPVYLGVISIIVALAAVGITLPLPSNDYIGIGASASTAAYFLLSGLWTLIYHGAVRRASALKK